MNWILFAPELYTLLMMAIFIGISLLAVPDPRRDFLLAFWMAAVGLALTVGAVGFRGTLFAEAYKVDLFSQLFKILIMAGLFLVIALCSELENIRKENHPEFYSLLALCSLAMMLLVSSVELLTLYVALELTSYSLYIMVAFRKGYGMHTEAGLKYFLLGASTSAVTLFGLASVYGSTRTTYVLDLIHSLPEAINTPMGYVGFLLMLCGFFFKLALFPFHIWAPTVYQGAANQVAAYIATATKAAAIGVLVRLVAMAGNDAHLLTQALTALSLLSMTLGNLAAIVQKDFKRLLAYSAVAHAGYVLIGILSSSEAGYAGAIFYAVAYMLMTYTCFFVLVKVAGDGRNLAITELAGLHRRSPLLAMALMLALFSLGGIPPTIGFTGKFIVFTAAMEKGHFLLVLLAMFNVVVSLYYYALVVKAAYLVAPEKELPEITLSSGARALTLFLVIVLVVGGLFPAQIHSVAIAAARLVF